MTAECGRTLATYVRLDSAAVSSMIPSNFANRLQIQGVPDNGSINAIT